MFLGLFFFLCGTLEWRQSLPLYWQEVDVKMRSKDLLKNNEIVICDSVLWTVIWEICLSCSLFVFLMSIFCGLQWPCTVCCASHLIQYSGCYMLTSLCSLNCNLSQWSVHYKGHKYFWDIMIWMYRICLLSESSSCMLRYSGILYGISC